MAASAAAACGGEIMVPLPSVMTTSSNPKASMFAPSLLLLGSIPEKKFNV